MTNQPATDLKTILERARADRARHTAEGHYKTNIRIARRNDKEGV